MMGNSWDDFYNDDVSQPNGDKVTGVRTGGKPGDGEVYDPFADPFSPESEALEGFTAWTGDYVRVDGGVIVRTATGVVTMTHEDAMRHQLDRLEPYAPEMVRRLRDALGTPDFARLQREFNPALVNAVAGLSGQALQDCVLRHIGGTVGEFKRKGLNLSALD
jgi:hypothetical protein